MAYLSCCAGCWTLYCNQGLKRLGTKFQVQIVQSLYFIKCLWLVTKVIVISYFKLLWGNGKINLKVFTDVSLMRSCTWPSWSPKRNVWYLSKRYPGSCIPLFKKKKKQYWITSQQFSSSMGESYALGKVDKLKVWAIVNIFQNSIQYNLLTSVLCFKAGEI